MRKFLMLATVAMLGACTAAQNAQVAAVQTTVATNLATVKTFTVSDLAAAEADAVKNSDAIAIPCYPALSTFVQSLQVPGTAPLTVEGAFLLHQQARDLANGVRSAGSASLVPPALKLACAAMLQDDATFVAGLAAIGSVGGAAAPVVGAVLSVLPKL